MTIIQAMGGDATESMVKWLGTSISVPEYSSDVTPEAVQIMRDMAQEGGLISPKSEHRVIGKLVRHAPSRKAIARKGRRVRKRR